MIESLDGLTVLLVDDENFSRKVVAGLLADMGAPTVLEAANGEEALTILGDRVVDLIISDFNMPKVHGLELLRAVRTGSNRAMPFAMLTGYSEKMLVDLALALDANAFLIKPVSKDGLKNRLIKMLSFVHSGDWLKDEEDYKAIDVDGALDNIAAPLGGGVVDCPSGVMPGRQPLFKSVRSGYTAGSRGGRKPTSGQFHESDLHQGPAPQPFGPAEVRGRSVPPPPSRAADVRSEKLSPYALPETTGAPSQYDTAGAPSQYDKGGERSCPLRELPDDAHLSRDVFTADGRLFMHAGTQLTPLIISILRDLEDMDQQVDHIRIKT